MCNCWHYRANTQAARRFLNNALSSLLIFATYNDALKFQKGMALQKKRIPRLVGLDRPYDIIDADGGRTLVAKSSAAR